MADVFISYKREDRRAAELVDARLRQEGWTTWWDTSLVAGDHWSEAINAELDAAKCVVVLWSEKSFASRWVQAEAHAGFERDILVAARLDGVALKPPFNIVQTADLRGWGEQDGLDQLVAGVRRKAGAAVKAADPHPSSPLQGGERLGAERTPPPARGRMGGGQSNPRLPPWLLAIGGGALAAALIFAGLAALNPSPPWRGAGGEGVVATAESPAVNPAPNASPSPPTPSPQGGEEAAPATPPPLQNGQTFRDCATCPEMVVIPAGSFVMGSPANEADRRSNEGPQRTVTIARFAAGKFEVTFDEWAACVAGGGCQSNANPGDEGWGRGRRPVINVSWNDAQEYVQWLNASLGAATPSPRTNGGGGAAAPGPYRLLTEAEWEYAARAGTSTAFWWGNSIRPEQAQFRWGQSYGGDAPRDTSPGSTVLVGSFESNAFGLHDVHGNVWEWVHDCYRNNYSGSPTNGVAVTVGDCARRGIRGGSWTFDPAYLRSAARYKSAPIRRYVTVGFRLARTL